MLSAKHCGDTGPCFFLRVRLSSPRRVNPSCTCRALNPTSFITATSLNNTLGSSFIDWPPTSTFSKYSSTNCTVGTTTRCTSGKCSFSSTAIIPICSRNTKNSSRRPASLRPWMSSISSPAYSACATRASSLHASRQFSRSWIALGSPLSCSPSCLALLLILGSFFPSTLSPSLLSRNPSLCKDELSLISKDQRKQAVLSPDPLRACCLAQVPISFFSARFSADHTGSRATRLSGSCSGNETLSA